MIKQEFKKNLPLRLELVKYEGKTYLYIEGIPAWSWLPNGEKNWIAPDTGTMYMNNKEFVDDWLIKNNFTG
jgi:hypothetical protein